MPTRPRRQFVRVRQSWYAHPALVGDLYAREEFTLALDPASDGSTDGEMAVRWVDVGGEQVPRLEAFNDSWHLLAHFADVLAQIGEGLDPDAFQRRLLELGLEDATKRKPEAAMREKMEAMVRAWELDQAKPARTAPR